MDLFEGPQVEREHKTREPAIIVRAGLVVGLLTLSSRSYLHNSLCCECRLCHRFLEDRRFSHLVCAGSRKVVALAEGVAVLLEVL